MDKAEDLLLISIIIPVYNRERTLNQTLQSILAQNYPCIELLLVDNNSQDQSLALCLEFQKKNSDALVRIEVLQELKKGANAARNAGLAQAAGEYLLFFDSDDRMYPDMISTIVEKIRLENRPSVVAYPSFLIFPDGHASRRPHYFSTSPADQLFDVLLTTHCFCMQRELLEKTGNWDENLHRWQDLEFGFRVLLQSDRIIWIKDKPLYEVCYHSDSISGSSFNNDHEILYASLIKIQRVLDKQPNGKTKDNMQLALCYKLCSLASQIRKEGNRILGDYYLQMALAKRPSTSKFLASCLLRFQYCYESKGGRGLWRLARILNY